MTINLTIKIKGPQRDAGGMADAIRDHLIETFNDDESIQSIQTTAQTRPPVSQRAFTQLTQFLEIEYEQRASSGLPARDPYIAVARRALATALRLPPKPADTRPLRQLLGDMWAFIENAGTNPSPAATRDFFALRERYRRLKPPNRATSD
jgi:hypothetical protein